VLQYIVYQTADVSLLSKHVLPVLEKAAEDGELQERAAYLVKAIEDRP
jgi:hypothetical protein